MKISVGSDRSILLEEVYNGVGLKTRDGEYMGICMRDSGFEFRYNGTWYSAKQGIVKKMKEEDPEQFDEADNIYACTDEPRFIISINLFDGTFEQVPNLHYKISTDMDTALQDFIRHIKFTSEGGRWKMDPKRSKLKIQIKGMEIKNMQLYKRSL